MANVSQLGWTGYQIPMHHMYVSSKLPILNTKTSKKQSRTETNKFTPSALSSTLNIHVSKWINWLGWSWIMAGPGSQPSCVIRSQEPAVVKYLRNQSSKLWWGPGPFLRLIPIRRDYLVCFDGWFIFGGFCREGLQSVGWNFGGKATRCTVSLDPVDFPQVAYYGWIILDQICTRESVSLMYIPWLKWGG